MKTYGFKKALVVRFLGHTSMADGQDYNDVDVIVLGNMLGVTLPADGNQAADAMNRFDGIVHEEGYSAYKSALVLVK